jgi:hypothetical protein
MEEMTGRKLFAPVSNQKVRIQDRFCKNFLFFSFLQNSSFAPEFVQRCTKVRRLAGWN